MKIKSMAAMLALVLALYALSPALALAETTTYDGTVVSGESVAVLAPFGGTLQTLSVRQGDVIAFGQQIATVATTKVYAPVDGTVSGLFGQAGDSAEDVAARMGAVLYIAPASKYQITADIQKAYNNSDNKYVNIGETVYLKSLSTSRDNTATGTITAVNGTSYTVETTDGELLMEETVVIYRSADYEATSRIGRGTVSRTPEVAVSGTGSIVYMHVTEGQSVTRGQLLYETVTGTLDGLYAAGNAIVSELDGIVASVSASVGASVNKGDTLLTVYPRDMMQVEMELDEYDLTEIAEGDAVSIALTYDDTGKQVFAGTVVMISRVSSAADGSDATYQAYVEFAADENVRLGMTAVVTPVGAAAGTAAADAQPASEAEEAAGD